MSSVRRISNSRLALRIVYYIWVAFPYIIRKPLTALGIRMILQIKKRSGVEDMTGLTPMRELGNLSFWGVPDIDINGYSLEIVGEVERPVRCSLNDLESMEATEGPVRMDCVGGFRNNSVMKGVSLEHIFRVAGIRKTAESAVFHCADGYYTVHRVADLLESGAFLAYEINGQRLPKFGYPLRLAAVGTYGYKWAKWLVRIDLVKGFPKGYWEQKGLPRRGKIGDTW